jgi:hypothetical protein
VQGDVKKTEYKLTWIIDAPDDLIPITLTELDHLLTSATALPFFLSSFPSLSVVLDPSHFRPFLFFSVCPLTPSAKALKKEDEFKNFVRPETKFETPALGEPAMRNIKKGDIIQLQRRGFFKVEQPYISDTRPMVCTHPLTPFSFVPYSLFRCCSSSFHSLPCCFPSLQILYNIPDGKTKGMSNLSSAVHHETATLEDKRKEKEAKKKESTKKDKKDEGEKKDNKKKEKK